MDVEQLKIVLEAEIGAAVKNLQTAQKILKEFRGELKEAETESKKAFRTWHLAFMSVSAAAMGTMYAMIRASPTLSVAMAEMQFQMERVYYVLGEELGPVFETVANLLGKLVDWFVSLPEPVQQFISMVVLLTAVLGPVISFLGALGPLLSAVGLGAGAAAGGVTVLGVSMSTLIPVIGLVIAAGALLYVAWQNNWLGIRDKTKIVVDWLSTNIPKFLSSLKTAWQKTTTLIKAVWTGDWRTIENTVSGVLNRLPKPLAASLKLQLRLVKDALGIVKAVFRGDWKAAANYAKDAIHGLLDWFTSLKDWMMEAGKKLIEWFVSGFEKAKTYAEEQVKNFTEWLAGFFGGSLPERGPLKNIVIYGKELGEAFTGGVRKTVNKITPVLNITPPGSPSYTVIRLEPKIDLHSTMATSPFDLKMILQAIFEELMDEYYRRGTA